MNDPALTASRPGAGATSSACSAEEYLTPSETVLLQGDRFARRDTIRTIGEKLLLDESTKVDATELAETALAAAVLANVEAGAMSVELQTNRHLFGLVKTRSMVVENREENPAWAEGSLEAAVLSMRPESGSRKMADLLYDVLEEDTGNPPLHALGLIKRGLAARGVLREEEAKTLKVFTTTRQVPTDELRSADLAPHLERAESLLAPWRERLEEWKYLRKAAGEALGRRAERSDDDFGDMDWD